MTDTDKYLVRTFWSPDRRYLVTVHVTDEGIMALQDDNGTEWQAAGEQQNMAASASVEPKATLSKPLLQDFREWNAVTGAIESGTGWCYEIESIFEDGDAEIARLRTALADLMKLKDHKDRNGKDRAYEYAQPRAWAFAREVLGERGTGETNEPLSLLRRLSEWDQFNPPMTGDHAFWKAAIDKALSVSPPETELAPAWKDLNADPPDFRIYGFHTGKKVRYRRTDGSEHVGVYQGYGLFGADAWADITHWMPYDERTVAQADRSQDDWRSALPQFATELPRHD